jgi:hypothetical protein
MPPTISVTVGRDDDPEELEPAAAEEPEPPELPPLAASFAHADRVPRATAATAAAASTLRWRRKVRDMSYSLFVL